MFRKYLMYLSKKIKQFEQWNYFIKKENILKRIVDTCTVVKINMEGNV